MRWIAISDIHGHYNELVALLKKLHFKKGYDMLIILGDFIDVGPESFRVVSLLKKLQETYQESTCILKGNHEDVFLDLAKLILEGHIVTEDIRTEPTLKEYISFTGYNLDMLNAYEKLSEQDQELYYEWLDNLPYTFLFNNHFFVHAGLNSNKSLYEQNKKDLLWGYRDEHNIPFYKKPGYDDVRIVFGHTPTKHLHNQDTIWIDQKNNQDKVGIDCGIWKSGVLGALVFDDQTMNYEAIYQERI